MTLSVFWEWLGTTAAGNLAEWVGGLGTTGALLLGFHIMRRDRVNREQAQAERVQLVLTADHLGTRFLLTNYSDSPVTGAHLILRSHTSLERILRRLRRRRSGVKEQVAFSLGFEDIPGSDAFTIPAGATAWTDPTWLPGWEAYGHLLKELVIIHDARGGLWLIEPSSRRRIRGPRAVYKEMDRQQNFTRTMFERQRRQGKLVPIRIKQEGDGDQAGRTKPPEDR